MNKYFSALIYLFVFCIVLALSKNAERGFISYDRKRELGIRGCSIKNPFILCCIAVMVLSLLAGIRSDEVGVDVGVYITPTYKYIQSGASFNDVLGIFGSFSVAYTLLAYITGRLFHSIGLLLFLIQLLTAGPVFLFAYRQRKTHSMTLIIATYLFLFYNNSLNSMRQSISCAFILLSISYLREKNYRNTIICILLAGTFHEITLFIALAIVILYFIVYRARRKWIWISIVLVLIVIGMLNYRTIISAVVYGIPGLSNNTKILGYYRTFILEQNDPTYFFGSFDKSLIFDWLARGCFILFPLLYTYQRRKVGNEFKLELFMVIISYIVYSIPFFVIRTVYGGRISYPFEWFYLLYLPRMFSKTGVNLGRNKTTVGRLFFWGIIVFDWFVWIIVFGWSGSNLLSFRV